MALNAKDLAVAAKTAASKSVMKSIPKIDCRVEKKAKKESGYREQTNIFLKDPTMIPL